MEFFCASRILNLYAYANMQSNSSPVHLRRDPPVVRFGMRYSQARFRTSANLGLSNQLVIVATIVVR